MKIQSLETTLNHMLEKLSHVFSQAETYSQIGLIIGIYLVAYIMTRQLRHYIPFLNNNTPKPGDTITGFDVAGKLLFPIIAIVLLRVSVEFSQYIVEDSWVMQGALAIAILLLANSAINLLVKQPILIVAFRWIGMPVIFFHFVGILGDVIKVLDAMAIQMGDIRLSVYGFLRLFIFGSLLFWLGRLSNRTGQNLIRNHESLDVKSKELFAKLYEIVLIFVVILLLLKLMGINLTALAVFGGAVGVGLGFGLQAIASNFISGVIIILDKSITVGDHVELEDGKSGLVTQLNMRSTTLETFDGKDIVVPNEKFITGSFTNWTHKNKQQRYRVDFSVGYKTDVRSMVELIKAAVATHPQVLSGEEYPIEERPDCEIDSFGDNGINMFVEFWMEGIDDGKNRVGGDLYLIILETLQQNNIEIPFPQRDVRIINPQQ
ncbi:MAG: mechanosensitive ion channel [Methylophilaceae bacterium]|jgi:small-conductance mechanosensitive channel|nr:mechanosensitive ion channel [Methylophilaceae bacterium]